MSTTRRTEDEKVEPLSAEEIMKRAGVKNMLEGRKIGLNINSPGKPEQINPCRECGGNNIKITDCGYSSFNVGEARCEDCGFTVDVPDCGCFPRNEIIGVWNKKNTLGSKIADRLRKFADELEKEEPE